MSRTPLAQFARQLRISDPVLASSSDRQLLLRSRSGTDEAAFAELVRRHERAVLAACRQVLTDPADIEDAFQATFLALLQQAKRMRCDTSLSGWLFAVAHRIAVRAIRSRTRKDRREKAAARPAAVAAEPAADLSWREAVVALHKSLDELPDRFRLPLVLCYLDGLSREEAAAQLGWTPGSVKAGLERGRVKLRAALARRGVTLSAGLLTVLAGAGPIAAASPELFAATLRVANGSAPTPILELARPTMFAVKTKAKFLFAPVTAAALCVGLLAAGKNEPLADPPRTAPAAQSADTKPTEPRVEKPILITPDRVGTGEPGTVAGRVTGPDGKPVANATVSWQQKPNTQGSFTSDPVEFYAAPVTGKTDADGRFKLDVMIRGRTPFRTFNPWAHVIVLADGYGPAAAIVGDLDQKWTQNIELKLVKTDVPIEGRLIDLEGRPVAGVTVKPVILFFNRASDLGPWLKSASGSSNGYRPDQYQVSTAIPAVDLKLTQTATTDKDGWFKLTGLGNERVVGLRVDGPTIETNYIQAMTRAGEKFRITNRLSWHQSGGPAEVYPAKFVHAVGPSKIVRGTVTAADTDKPLAGVQVSATVAGTTPPVRIVTHTDKDGTYTLTGYPRNSPYWLRFEPQADQPYVAFLGGVSNREDGKPATVDMKLPRGVVVTGTVTDKTNGKPLEAVVDYHPHNGNPNLGGKFAIEVQVACNPKDGSYRLVALPGEGLIAAKISNPCRGAYLSGVGAEQVTWFDKAKNNFMSANFGFPRSFYDAYAGIDSKPSDDPLKTDLKLDPGVNVAVRFVDPDGKPLVGCSLNTSGHGPDVQDIHNLPTDRVTLYALDPAKPAVAIVRHEKRNLVGTFSIDAAMSREIVVKLNPAAVVTLRLIDDVDGSPLEGVVVGGNVNVDGQSVFARFYGKADKDGKVRIEVVPTGIPVSGSVQHFTGKNYKNLKVFEGLTLKPGQTRDLGDVKLQLNE